MNLLTYRLMGSAEMARVMASILAGPSRPAAFSATYTRGVLEGLVVVLEDLGWDIEIEELPI